MVTQNHSFLYKDLRDKYISSYEKNDNHENSVIIQLDDEFDDNGNNNMGPTSMVKKKRNIKQSKDQDLPLWAQEVVSINGQMNRLEHDISKLTNMHNQLPSFSSSSTREKAQIDELAEYIKKGFTQLRDRIKDVTTQSGSADSIQIRSNVQASLATRLQSLSQNFRKSQQDYLNMISGREKQKLEYLGSKYTDDSLPSFLLEDPDDSEFLRSIENPEMTMLREEKKEVLLRDAQVRELAQSITEINMLFKDIASMVVEQGTMLDRIDYHITTAAAYTEEAVVSLKTSDELAGSSWKCFLGILIVVFIFSVVVIVLLILKRKMSH